MTTPRWLLNSKCICHYFITIWPNLVIFIPNPKILLWHSKFLKEKKKSNLAIKKNLYLQFFFTLGRTATLLYLISHITYYIDFLKNLASKDGRIKIDLFSFPGQLGQINILCTLVTILVCFQRFSCKLS